MMADALLSDLTDRGEATGIPQTVHIFQGRRQDLVLAFSRTKPNAGYFNIIDAAAMDYVHKRFAAGEKGLTRKPSISAAASRSTSRPRWWHSASFTC